VRRRGGEGSATGSGGCLERRRQDHGGTEFVGRSGDRVLIGASMSTVEVLAGGKESTGLLFSGLFCSLPWVASSVSSFSASFFSSFWLPARGHGGDAASVARCCGVRIDVGSGLDGIIGGSKLGSGVSVCAGGLNRSRDQW
jgi:hypothetical protein